MLRKVEFENFMTLKNASVTLDPFNVFIGRNGAGKSAVFKGLVTLSKLVGEQPVYLRKTGADFFLEPGVTLDDLVWMGNTGLPIRFRVWFDSDQGEPDYSLELTKGRAGWSVSREKIRINGAILEVDDSRTFKHPTETGAQRALKGPLPGTLRRMVQNYMQDEKARTAIEPIIENSRRFGSVWRYRPSAFDIAAFFTAERPSKGVESSRRKNQNRLSVWTNGRGLSVVMQELQGRSRDVYEKIENRVHSIFDHVTRIGFDAGPEGVRLNFMTTRSNALVPAPQEADGVLLATFLCWRLFTAVPPMTICLEDPENGLYPELIDERYKLLREFTEPASAASPTAQILVSSHSSEFLRVLKKHQSEFPMVRAVGFLPGQGTKIESLRGYKDAGNLLDHFGSGESVLPSMWATKTSPQ